MRSLPQGDSKTRLNFLWQLVTYAVLDASVFVSTFSKTPSSASARILERAIEGRFVLVKDKQYFNNAIPTSIGGDFELA